MFFALSLLWFIRETKTILFWLYLWQLKEYHIGRFIDHFQTTKGKQLLFNKLIFLKIILVFWLFINFIIPPFYSPLLIFLIENEEILLPLFSLSLGLIFSLYALESIATFKNFLQKELKKPVLTKKTAVLIFTTLFCQFLFLFLLYLRYPAEYPDIFLFSFWLLIFDLSTSLITSVIVLFFQPLAVLGRSQIIRKAIKKREQFKNLLVIGITGSYGKTSTKEFLATILSQKFRVLKTKERQNSEVGISQCILNDLKPGYEIFVVEMGAYNRGGIKLLCDITKPKIGILTGINKQHLATFGSLENIISTKFELIESLPEDGVAILNWDNNYIKSKIKNFTPPPFDSKSKGINKISASSLNQQTKGGGARKSKFRVKIQKFYSIKEGVDIWAENIKVEKEEISFKVFSEYGNFADFKVNLFGVQNIPNILAATCCATTLGMNLEEIARACKRIEPWQSGMEIKKGREGFNIIDATYSANPAGVLSHLEYLKIWSGQKVIVMPCLIELGQATVEVHKRIGQKIGEICDLAIITTKERFGEIKEGAVERKMKEENILFIENPKKIFEKIKSFCLPSKTLVKETQSNAVILLESRVPVQLMSLLVK